MHTLNLIEKGNITSTALGAVIFIHGRGGTAEDILSLDEYLPFENFYLAAPQAENNTWYPYSFMAPRTQNEPWLTSAIEVVDQLVQQIILKGINKENIYFVGFSQGACLTLEYIATHPAKYGGVIAFIGGLIGDVLDLNFYNGNLLDTPIYIGTSDPDMHVPISRVEESKKIFESMNAAIKVDYFKQLGHTISSEGLKNASLHVLKK